MQRSIKMHIEKKTPKRGFSLDANIFTLSNIVCGLLAVVSGIAILSKPSHRSRKKPMRVIPKLSKAVGAMGGVFSLGKAVMQRAELENIVSDIKEQYQGIEIEDAIPIASEEDVYEYINSQNEI